MGTDKAALEADVIKAIKTVYDPEIPVDVFELGLIYEISIEDDCAVNILMTLTSPNCPSAEEIPRDIETKVSALEEVKSVSVKITFNPPWDKDMMSEEAQLELGML
jgi:FeS assembly SUF system protein